MCFLTLTEWMTQSISLCARDFFSLLNACSSYIHQYNCFCSFIFIPYFCTNRFYCHAKIFIRRITKAKGRAGMEWRVGGIYGQHINGNHSPKSLYVVAISPVPHHFVPGIIPLNTENGLFLNWNALLVSSFGGWILRRWLRFKFCFSTISHWFIRFSISLNSISNGRLIFDSCFSNLFPALSLLQNK